MKELLNKIHHADCLEFMKQLPDKCIDLVLTDPPYGVTNCDWDILPNLELLWQELHRVTKNNAAIIVTATQPFTTDLISSNRSNYKHRWIWNKNLSGNFLLAKIMPMQIVEDVIVFCKEKVNYYPIMRKGQPRKKGSHTITENFNTHLKKQAGNYDEYYPTNVLFYPNTDRVNSLHPTQKPIQLFKYLVETYTNKTGIVLDCFSGSGTTALACHDLNLDFICIEKDEDYYKASVQRLEKHKQQLRLI
jgi:site-specific DNA-methyltransferase (adenine-specific)